MYVNGKEVRNYEHAARNPTLTLPYRGRGQNSDNFVLRLLHHEVRTNE